MFFIIPNYRTAPTMQEFSPIGVKQKFKIASQDAFDWGTLAVAAIFAGQGQLTHSSPSFGQGAKGFGH